MPLAPKLLELKLLAPKLLAPKPLGPVIRCGSMSGPRLDALA
jgi:hypothetical protein